MVRNKLGEAIEESRFLDVFKRYIVSRIRSKSFLPIAVWNFDMKKLNSEELEFRVGYLTIDFSMMRRLQSAKFLMDVDIIIIDNFSKLPPSVIRRLVSNIKDKKTDYLFVFGDKKTNCHKISSDIMNSMTNFLVKL